MYNTTEKSNFLDRRKKDLEEFYQQNYFSERNNEIVTKPVRHIEFISSGLKTQPFESIALGVKLVNINPSELITVNITSSYGRLLYTSRLQLKNKSYSNVGSMSLAGNGFSMKILKGPLIGVLEIKKYRTCSCSDTVTVSQPINIAPVKIVSVTVTIITKFKIRSS